MMGPGTPLARRKVLTGGAALAGWVSTGAEASARPQTFVTEEVLHGRSAYVLQNPLMRLSVLPGGGFIAEARLKSPDPRLSVNPMRVPHYPTIDPYTYDPAKHGALYGVGMQRRLLSGYMGQFTCFPHFTSSSAAEFAQDYGQHGELIAVKWRRVPAAAPALVMDAELPITQYGFERRIVLPPDETVAYVTETAENLVRYDRPLQWVEHTAFGPPFVSPGRMFADASAQSVVVGRAPQAHLASWPVSQDASGVETDYRPFTGRTSLWIVRPDRDTAWFVIHSADFDVLLGYLWDARSDPWLLDFQENRHAMERPWDGKTVMRGLCFGDSAVSGLRNAVTQASSFGIPTYSWIEARARRSKRYAIFVAAAPSGFAGVEDVRIGGGNITLLERNGGRSIVLKASGLADFFANG